MRCRSGKENSAWIQRNSWRSKFAELDEREFICVAGRTSSGPFVESRGKTVTENGFTQVKSLQIGPVGDWKVVSDPSKWFTLPSIDSPPPLPASPPAQFPLFVPAALPQKSLSLNQAKKKTRNVDRAKQVQKIPNTANRTPIRGRISVNET